MRDDKCDFVLLGMMDLQKSVDSATKVADGVAERRLVIGEISNNNPDEENERLIQKSLDWSYFDDKGWIKYEHVANDPAHIIGCPHERVTSEDGKSTLIKGAIFNNKKFSDSTWELIESINDHNKMYPEFQKCLGWSIEGNYTDGKTGKGGVRKAKVINVVITPNPVNKSVWLKQVEENHKLFAKSLTATPTSTDLASKTGGDAIVKENIDGELKVTAEDPPDGKQKKPKKKKKPVNKSIGSNVMFKSIEEAVTHFLNQGETQENADKLAKSFFPDEEDEATLDSLTKSITKLQSLVEKSITSDDDSDEEDLPFVENNDDDDPEVLDAAPFLLKLNKSVSDLSELVSQKIEYDSQRDQKFAEALDELSQLKQELSVVKSLLTIKSGDNEVGVAKAVEVLMKSQVRPVDINSFQFAPDPNGTGASKPHKTLSYAELQEKLEKGIAAKVITQSEAVQAEGLWRHKENDQLDKIISKIE